MILRNLAFNRRILREVGCVGSRPTLRSMSAGCWKCGTATRPLELFCPADSCGAVQSLELHQINAFDLFRVDHYYDLDQKALETNFKEIQKQLHPDKFTTKSTPEREASNTTSSTANQAYQILRSPISRAEYMLKESFGIDFDETKSYEDSELMMEVFDLRESIQESEEGEELQSLLLQLRAEVQEQSKVFAHNMTESGRSEEERDKALRSAVRLRYYAKMVEEIEQKLP